MDVVDTRGIREYLGRDWQAARASKDAYWAERVARLGPLEAFRIADDLRRQVLQRHPSWPSPSERAADLEAHVRLAGLLRRARAARRR
jgi:hypothetical protein